MDDPVAHLEAAGLPDDAARAIRGGNAAALFGLAETDDTEDHHA